MTDTVIELAEKFKTALSRNDLAAQRRLITAYRGLWATIKEKVDNLILEISMLEEPTPAQIQRLKRYGILLDGIRDELTRYQAFTQIEMSTAAREAIRLGEGNARILVAASLGDTAIAAKLTRINPVAIEKLLGFLTPEGALFKRLEKLAGVTAERVANAIVEGVGLGKNPKDIARAITKQIGMALTDSMRMTRTVQLWSYREANRASYLANDDVVKGWIWFADTTNACPACMAMHGTEHGLDESLDDHFNGGCAELPLVIGAKNDIPSGESVFSQLSEAEQKARLGADKWQAWQDGKFSFDQLATQHSDEVYGHMRSETPLWELLGAEPPVRTR